MTINDMVLLARDIISQIPKSDALNKQLSDGTVTRLMDSASLKQLKRKLGLPEHYQPGMNVSAQQYEATPKISHDVAPFKKMRGWNGEPVLPVDADGFVTLPDDYFLYSSMIHRTLGVEKAFEFMPDEEFDLQLGDPLTSPNYRVPIANLQNGYIRVAPKDIKYVALIYIKRPTRPVYKTKTNSGYRQFDEANSQDFEWDDVNRIDIVHTMLYDLGINLQRGDLVQYAQKYQQQGV